MTKAELNKVRRYRRKVTAQEDYLIGLRGLRTTAERVMTIGRSNVPSKRVESLVIKIVAAEEKLQWMYEELERLCDELGRRLFDEVLEMRLYNILTLRYVECLTWTEIAKRLGISRRRIYDSHQKYLREHLPPIEKADNIKLPKL